MLFRSTSIRDLLLHFRVENPNVRLPEDAVVTGSFTQAMLDYLKRLIEEGRILLSAKSIYPEIYEGNNYFMLTPIVGPDECVEVEGQNIQVCADPIEVIIHASKQSPILKFGNSSIRYPESYEGNPALRTSLQAMQGIIHVPVRRASDVTLNKEVGIVQIGRAHV